MMRIILFLLPIAFCGCFSKPPQARLWSIEPTATTESAQPVTFRVSRLGASGVLAPFDRATFAVLRADGSVAEDGLNRFAAQPSLLVRRPLMAALTADGRFGRVVDRASTASTACTVEVVVTDLCLDCRITGKRVARAVVRVDVVTPGTRGVREVALAASASGECDAAAGDYTAAFSTAFGMAVQKALMALHPPALETNSPIAADTRKK